jgi:hypothetical protein
MSDIHVTAHEKMEMKREQQLAGYAVQGLVRKVMIVESQGQ